MNFSRRLMRGSCAYTHGNYSVPVALATPWRPATTLLDAQFTLSQGNNGGALGIAKPEPMFGVTPQVLKAHGLTDPFVEALKTWNEVSALLTDKQREQINLTFSTSCPGSIPRIKRGRGTSCSNPPPRRPSTPPVTPPSSLSVTRLC